MKQTADMQAIQANMLPGQFAAEGFLGSDTRSLTDILLADQETVNRLDTTHEAIADRMQALTNLGMTTPETPVMVDENFSVQVDEYMGFIPCPFSDHVNSAKRNTLVKNRNTGAAIQWSDLSIHMIRAHGFYEGIGAHFRLDPAYLVTFLGQ